MTPRAPDRARDPGSVHGGVVLVVALATAAVMALGVLLAWQLQAGASATSAASSARYGSPPSEKNGIEMALFVRHRAGGAGGVEPEPATRPPGPAERALVAGSSPHGEPERELGQRGQNHPEHPVVDAAHRLQSYGWTDRARGRVHIPIARAMDLVVEREARSGAAP